MSNTYLIKVPHLKVQNANALSSPYTIGFPAMTAWLGFMHALERKLKTCLDINMEFSSLAVISHECDLQTYRGANDFVSSIIGTGNPLNSDGTRAAFIEEARCHLEVSLLISYWVGTPENRHSLPQDSSVLDKIHDVILTMKLAGGDILSVDPLSAHTLLANEPDGASRRSLLNSVMPGYALIERRDLMIESMENGQDAMDSLLDYVTVEWQCTKTTEDNQQLDEAKQQFEWRGQRRAPGWLVPIATGFQGISPLGQAKNQRDPDIPHRFAESVVTLGQFVLANRINNINGMLWEYAFDEIKNLYLCQQVEPNFISMENK